MKCSVTQAPAIRLVTCCLPLAVQVDTMTENQSCTYNIIGRSSAGCPTSGDPFDIPANFYRNKPADSFGFCVLGSVCTIVVLVVYNLGDARGWWDPIKRV